MNCECTRSGNFHVSYIETYLGEIQRCRWDRHEQNHNTRDHFHPFPAAGTSNAEDRDFPADVTALLETVVLPWVETRLGTIWAEHDESWNPNKECLTVPRIQPHDDHS